MQHMEYNAFSVYNYAVIIGHLKMIGVAMFFSLVDFKNNFSTSYFLSFKIIFSVDLNLILREKKRHTYVCVVALCDYLF